MLYTKILINVIKKKEKKKKFLLTMRIIKQPTYNNKCYNNKCYNSSKYCNSNNYCNNKFYNNSKIYRSNLCKTVKQINTINILNNIVIKKLKIQFIKIRVKIKLLPLHIQFNSSIIFKILIKKKRF